MSERQQGGCLRCGCLGCGLSGAAVLALLVGLSAVQWSQSGRDREPVAADVVRELPGPGVSQMPSLPAPADTDGEIGKTSPELEEFDPGVVASTEGPLELDLGEQLGRGRVVLELDIGEFEVRAGAPGEPVRIDGTYESGAFQLIEELETEDDGSWTYRVEFGPKRGFLAMALSGAGNNPDNRLTIYLPPDRAFDLVGELGIGEADLDLARLQLGTVQIEAGTGDHRVRFSEPTQTPIEALQVEKGIGLLVLDQIGNASPLVVEIEQSIGSAEIDLTGSWQRDCTIEIDSSIGEQSLVVPDDVHVELGEFRSGLGETANNLGENVGEGELPPGTPTLTIEAEGSIAELSIRSR